MTSDNPTMQKQERKEAIRKIQDMTHSSVTTPFAHVTLKPRDAPGLVAQPVGEV